MAETKYKLGETIFVLIPPMVENFGEGNKYKWGSHEMYEFELLAIGAQPIKPDEWTDEKLQKIEETAAKLREFDEKKSKPDEAECICNIAHQNKKLTSCNCDCHKYFSFCSRCECNHQPHQSDAKAYIEFDVSKHVVECEHEEFCNLRISEKVPTFCNCRCSRPQPSEREIEMPKKAFVLLGTDFKVVTSELKDWMESITIAVNQLKRKGE